MIVATGMGTLIADAIKIPFKQKDIKSDDQGYCTLEEIICHVMRCGLVHRTGEDSKIIWNNRIPLALDKDGNLNLRYIPSISDAQGRKTTSRRKIDDSF